MGPSLRLLAAFALSVAACGTDGLVSDPDPSLEPPAGTDAYDPSDGQGEGGGGYYTTTGQVTAGPSGPDTTDDGEDASSGGEGSSGASLDCEEDVRVCPQVFTLADDGYGSVDVMGDFAEDGWDVGAAMELVDGSWTATVDVGWAADTEYRFRIDGSADWILDPANEDTENDNSVVRATMCELYTCP